MAKTSMIKKASLWVKENRGLTAFVAVHVVFLSFFIYFNYRTGYYIDDYGYMYMFSRGEKLVNNRIDSIFEVLRSQYEHYFIMNGRSVAHTLLQTALMLGKSWFNVINTFFCFALSYGMYILAKRPGARPDALLQLLMYLIPWVIFPEYGKIHFVCCMAANYMWTIALIVWAIIPFRLLFGGRDIFEKRKVFGACLMALLGVIAGWSSENGSAAMLFLIGCMGLYYLIARKKIPFWCFTGFAGMLTGFIMMLSSPGYDIRSEYYAEPDYLHQFARVSVEHILPYFLQIMLSFGALFLLLFFRLEKKNTERLKVACSALFFIAATRLAARLVPHDYKSEYLLVIMFAGAAACAAIALICRKNGVEIFDLAEPVMLIVTGFVATCAMTASPSVETRSEFQFVIFFTCGAVPVFDRLYALAAEDCPAKKSIRAGFTVCAALCFLVSLGATVPHTNENYDQFRAREQYISDCVSTGITELSLINYVIPDDTHVGMFGIMNSDPDYWINRAVCWHYGLDSVRYYENPENAIE